MKVDFIIVGLGLAGIAFAEELKKRGKTFIVFEDQSQRSSLVAGGMYNPVILKRFTPVWNAKEQLSVALPFYHSLEKEFERTYDEPLDIYRTFKSFEEQNNWSVASDQPLLADFMQTEICDLQTEKIQAPFKTGRVTRTGRIRVKDLVTDYRDRLEAAGLLVDESFIHQLVITWDDHVEYKHFKAGKIVFCEGNGLKKNPFFKGLPLNGTKGELITVHSPELKIDYIVKSAIFIMPLGDDLYKIGATFNWSDKSNTPTEDGRNELESKLRSVLNCDYTVIDHEAGVRPTTGDRRPLLGTHKDNARLAVLNGLGTRGVMIAPLMAKKLYMHLEEGFALDREISISRFKQRN